MGKYAVVKNDFVVNVIVCGPEQVSEMTDALLADMLVDAIPYGLCIGDFWNGHVWTRNLDGVQVELEELTPQQQTDYNGLRDEIAELEGAMTEAEAALREGVDSIG